MHIPAADAPSSYFLPAPERDDLIRRLEQDAPGLVILRKMNQTHVVSR